MSNIAKVPYDKREGDDPSIAPMFREAERFPGQSFPYTTGERVASHIPGTDAHAERSELPGHTAPGSRVTANVPGTAEHERKREFQRETGTGLTNPASDARDIFGAENKQSGTNYDTQVGTHGTSIAEPVNTSGRHTGNVPSTHAAEGTAPFRTDHGTRTENRVSVGDKIVGTAEKTLGKVMNKPAMVEKGVERQVSPNHVP